MVGRMKINPFKKVIQNRKETIDSLKNYSSMVSGSGLNPFKSVGMKLFLSFFLSIVTFVLVVGLVSYNNSKEIVKEKVAESALGTIVQANGKMDVLLNQYEQMSMQFIVDTELQKLFVAALNPNSDDFTKFDSVRNIQTNFTQYTFTDSNIQAIHLFLSNGQTVSTGGSVLDAEIREADWYKTSLESNGGVVWIPTSKEGIISTTTKTPTFGIARKLKDPSSGTDVGVVLIEIKYQLFTKEIGSLSDIENNQRTLIVNSENKIIYSEDPELIAQDMTFEVTGDSADRFEGVDQAGEDALIAFSPSAINGWKLIGTYPISTLVESAQIILKSTIIIAIIAAVIAILLSILIVRNIGSPLVQLRNLMKKGEQGNLHVRANIKNRDEIGELGTSFNEMMEKITFLVMQTSESAQQVLNNSVELLDSSKKTALSAKEISVATEEIAGGASTLALEAEKGNDLTNHIGVQMRNVVDANIRMGTSAAEVRKVSEQGTAYMDELMSKTSATEDKTRLMVEKVDKLKESTSSIRKILDVLNSVAKQTNILSLNATIEAARAGAAGKGFMVVADEIRKLADQSRQSIDVVAQITETIQSEIDETVQVLSEAYPMFQEQIVSVKEADKIFNDVQNNMNGFIVQLDSVTESIQQLEQSQAILSEAMSNVSAVSEESSATSQEVASLSTEQLSVSEGLVTLAERLETLSNSLKDSLSKFTV
jgi:methyl-accepting chemotaxis protein